MCIDINLVYKPGRKMAINVFPLKREERGKKEEEKSQENCQEIKGKQEKQKKQTQKHTTYKINVISVLNDKENSEENHHQETEG